MGTLHIIILLFLIIYSVVTTVFLYRMIIKEESLEEYYETKIQNVEQKLIQTKLAIENTLEGLNQVDIRGSFESDDEVGFAFKDIKKLNEELLQYIIELNAADDAEKSQP